MANLGKFQTMEVSHWTGMGSNNHLAAAFREEPQRLGDFITQLQAYRYGPTLMTYLSKLPKKNFKRDEEFRWDIITSSKRNIPVIEVRGLDNQPITSGMVGVGGQRFYVVFPEHWFNDGDVIVGERNEVYPIRTLGHPRMEGAHAVHLCELMGAVTSGIPAEEFAYGKRFSKEYAPVEKEGSRKVSDIHFMNNTAMRNEFSRIRIQHKEYGDKINRKLKIGVPVMDSEDGQIKTMEYWMHYVDMQLEDEFAEDKNRLVMYGRSNRSMTGEYLNFGKSGNVLQMGAGIREQQETSNYEMYHKFTLKLLNDMIFNMIDHLPKSAIPNTIVIRTGRRGALQFHEAVANEVSGWERWDLDAAALGMVRKVSSDLHSNALGAGYQFTEWHAPMNVNIRVEVDPMYDDPVRNKILHPNGGVAESYRMDFDLLGNKDQANIMLCGLEGEDEIRGIERGLRDPFTGKVGGDIMTDEDASTFHKMWFGGALVKDPTAHVTLVPACLAA